MRMTVSTTVAAPPERVFEIAADVPRWAEVIRGVESVEMLTPGPVRVGTRFRETRIMHGSKAAEEMTVAEFAPPHRFVLTAENHGARYRAEHLFAAEDGGTRLTLSFEGKPVTLFAYLMMPLGYLLAGAVRQQLEADLADLKRAAEQGR
jgi:carbon monoxide dehydrogenase subunit G